MNSTAKHARQGDAVQAEIQADPFAAFARWDAEVSQFGEQVTDFCEAVERADARLERIAAELNELRA